MYYVQRTHTTRVGKMSKSSLQGGKGSVAANEEKKRQTKEERTTGRELKIV